jgi:hypothetical protein
MRNNLALLGIPDLPIYAFRHVGDRKICPQGGVSSVVESVSDTVSNAISSVSDALATVDDTVNTVLPGGWVTVASVAAGLPPDVASAVQAANVVAKGGSIEDAAKAAVIGQVAGQVGGAVGAETGSSFVGNVAGGTTGGLLSGKSPEQALTGGVISGGVSQVTPSSLFTPSTSGTTGATNMADTNFFSGYDPNQAIVQDNIILAQNPYLPSGVDLTNAMTGGEGFGPGGNYLTPQEIAKLQPTVYSGSGDVNSSILSSLDTTTQSIIKQALAAGGSAAQGAKNYLSSLFSGSSGANLIQGGLQTAGGLMQTQASKDAALKAEQDLLAATGSATTGSQFRPVGVTTRFGTSQFNINPVTGQLESAGYTAAPEITSAENQLLNLGASYLAQTPEQVAQNYLSKQYELLDPSRQRQLASIRNQAFQTGRGGLSVGSTGLRPSGAQGLMGANPELEAYYNALAQQDAQLAAGAQTAGQQQVLYGAGLFGQAGNLESMAQQPFSLGTGLGTSISGAGANAGRLGLTGASLAAGYGTSPAATTSPGAYIASGLGSPTSTLGAGLANWLTSTAPTTGGITSQGMNAPTVDAYGNYVPLGYANY